MVWKNILGFTGKVVVSKMEKTQPFGNSEQLNLTQNKFNYLQKTKLTSSKYVKESLHFQ